MTENIPIMRAAELVPFSPQYARVHRRSIHCPLKYLHWPSQSIYLILDKFSY
jgi:hypothetical protein